LYIDYPLTIWFEKIRDPPIYTEGLKRRTEGAA